MRSAVCLFFIVFPLVWYVQAIDVMSVLESIPSSEREEFVQYYATLGYQLTNSIEPSDDSRVAPEMSDAFAIALYDLVQSTDIICFEDGTCIEGCDPGIYPKKRSAYWCP